MLCSGWGKDWGFGAVSVGVNPGTGLNLRGLLDGMSLRLEPTTSEVKRGQNTSENVPHTRRVFMSPHETRIPKSKDMFRRQPVVLQYSLFSSAVRYYHWSHSMGWQCVQSLKCQTITNAWKKIKSDTFISPGQVKWKMTVNDYVHIVFNKYVNSFILN